jgi:hypothetical protein
MEFYVGAVFDTADFADFASGRIRDITGVVGFNIYRNKYAAQQIDNDVLPPATGLIPGMTYRGEKDKVPIYPVNDMTDYDWNSTNKFEPANRRDVLLTVKVNSNKAALEVSRVLTNAGGRDVKIFSK